MAAPQPIGFPIDPVTRAAAERALPLGLCAECFGRLFGRRGHGLTNAERAAALATELGATLRSTEPCPLCRGLFDRWGTWLDRGARAAEGWEFRRFACGSRWDPEILAREETIAAEIGSADAESARNAFNREWGKRLAGRLGAEADTAHPDLVLLADLPLGRVETTVMPLYFRGRYRKLDRTLPQTRWPCRRCRGRGCDHCGGTGKTYPESVEELVGGPVLAATGGDGTRFHGMGREDIDARMLGRGRPFVLEILRPHIRTVDPATLARAISEGSGGRVEVVDWRTAAAADVVAVKEASPEKSYRVVVGAADVPAEKVKEALSVALDRAIAQRTPTRVAHRRSDRVRTRRIVAAQLVEADAGRFTLDLRAEAGTYIKEWVEGDGGRTEPSLAGLLGRPLKVEALDVLEIHATEG